MPKQSKGPLSPGMSTLTVTNFQDPSRPAVMINSAGIQRTSEVLKHMQLAELQMLAVSTPTEAPQVLQPWIRMIKTLQGNVMCSGGLPWEGNCYVQKLMVHI